MDYRYRHVPVIKRGLISLLVLVAILSGFGSLAASATPEAAAPDAQAEVVLQPTSLLQATTEIVVDLPALNPLYIGDCAVGWYPYRNQEANRDVYFALNTTDAGLVHWGEWIPQIPQEGYYHVSAFVSSHSTVTCNGKDVKATKDTSSAKYIVNHANGSSTVIVDQLPLENEWAPLGTYRFEAGTRRSVSLMNVTDETSGTKLVSYSAIKFTYISNSKPAYFFPLVYQAWEPFQNLNVWTADTNGAERSAFVTGETLRLNISGRNNTGSNAAVEIKWNYSGQCSNALVASHSTTLEPGSWSRYVQITAPDCDGFYSLGAEISYGGTTFHNSASNHFIVNPPGTVITVQQQMFDKCTIPTLSQMATWWSNSPYTVVNLYIGGALRACANADLDADWVATASQMGWTFVPTWVGPQAPCTSYKSRMSSDPDEARAQGHSEASAASAAASRLGFSKSRIIYYDLEAYSRTTACDRAVKSFMQGWVERLHQLGAKGGVYASASRSNMSEWATNSPPPDDVWIASWIKSSYYPNATVWGINNLSDSLWANHKRLRQYAGGHSETWGGVSMTIDSNVTDGEVSALYETQTAAATVERQQLMMAAPETIRDAQLVSGEQGWVLVGNRLYWRESSEADWREITPEEVQSGGVLSVHFATVQRGWMIQQSLENGTFSLFQTADGGASWQSSLLTAIPQDVAQSVGSAYLEFANESFGWLVLKLTSGSNFSVGVLYKTLDGGVSWTEWPIPIGDPAKFVDPEHGWVKGGVSGDELYITSDGGQTWTLQPATALTPAAPQLIAPRESAELPEGMQSFNFTSVQNGWGIVQTGDCRGEKTSTEDPLTCSAETQLVETNDSGANWTEVPPP